MLGIRCICCIGKRTVVRYCTWSRKDQTVLELHGQNIKPQRSAYSQQLMGSQSLLPLW